MPFDGTQIYLRYDGDVGSGTDSTPSPSACGCAGSQ
jgi:hypothetical protein